MSTLSTVRFIIECEKKHIVDNPHLYVNLSKIMENKRTRTYTIDVIKQYIEDSNKLHPFSPVKFYKIQMYSFGNDKDGKVIRIDTRSNYLYLESTKLLNDIISAIVKINYVFVEKNNYFFGNSIEMNWIYPIKYTDPDSFIFHNDDDILKNIQKI